jgi:hypothetical protein
MSALEYLLIDSTSSIYPYLWLKDAATFCFYPVTVSEKKSALYEYKNTSANKHDKGA